MTQSPPQLVRCLAFITERLARAARDAEMRPSKVRQQRLRSLELLAAACVSEAARHALQSRPALPPRLDPEPLPLRPVVAPPPSVADEVTESDLRGVWAPPPG